MEQNKREFNYKRYVALFVVMCIIVTIISGRLAWLQIVKADEYKEQANNRSHTILLKNAPRGEIYDRNENVLATNRQSFILIYTPTTESNKYFFETMTKVFEILDNNSETQYDDFALKIEPFRLDYISSITWNERRFKKDRGYDYKIMRSMFDKSKLSELTQEEIKIIDEELDKITSEYIFYNLIDKYKIYDLVKEDYIQKELDLFNNEELLSEDEILQKIQAEWKNLDSEDKIEFLTNKYDLTTIRRYMVVKDKKLMQSFSGYKPIIISNDLKEQTAFIFEQIQSELPGISVIKQPVRYYPNNELASNILGYIKKIDQSKAEKYSLRGYDVSEDFIGASGVEGVYEEILRGTKGQEAIEINRYGRKVKSLGELTPYAGKNIELTIDMNLQEVAEKALDDTMAYRQERGNRDENGNVNADGVDTSNATRGAAVVIDVNTGEILALASRPGYDPNIFAVPGRLNDEEYRDFFMPDLKQFGKEYIKERNLEQDPEYKDDLEFLKIKEEEFDKGNIDYSLEDFILDKIFPLASGIANNTSIREDYYDIYPKPTYNYATMSLIPPGSTFKILSAIAGLEETVIFEDTKILDEGYYNKRYKEFKGASWMWNDFRTTHGKQNVVEAIRDSNNYFFFEVADRLFEKGGIETKNGLDMLAKYAWEFGLGIDPLSKDKPKTGIEIYENFGQVYNYESGKNILAVLYIRQLYDFLMKGSASHWVGEYKSIDIVPRVDELKEIYQIKKDITNLIKSEMKNDDHDYKEQYQFLRDNVEPLLRQLISISPQLLSRDYNDNDINSIINTINYSINDAKAEMISGTNLYNASIGQGTNNFTPLQLANYIATVVNGGHRYEVHLVNKIYDQEGNIIEDKSEPVIIEETGISEGTVETVKKGMLAVTSSDQGGTAYKVFKDFPISNGGKTGSATFNEDQHSIGREAYGIYTGFAPYDNPQIAVCVVIFDGGHGGYVAPVAKAIYEEYFREEILRVNSEYEFMYNDESEQNTKEIVLELNKN